VDFYDRLTYEEVLRAAVAAAYHPAPQGTRGEGTSVTCIVSITPPGPPDSGTLRTQMLARIAHGFERLIGNFMEGLNDPKYMEDIPPVYLIELFVIITTYLRVVWRDGMLANPLFIDHSLKLLRTFGGLDGFLFSLRARLGPDEMERQERRLGLSAQTWLHAYAVAELLKKGGDRRLYDLAAWMRNFAAQQKSPDILAELPEETYRRLWCSSFPAARRSDPSADVAAQLRDIARMYDDTSLLAEITTWNGARARVSTQNVANLSKIPALEIHVALSEAELDRCFQFFVVFLLWPQPKAAAWVRFSNVNPIIEPDDIASVTIFYRGDQQSFLFAVLRGSSQYDPEICRWGIQAPEFDRMKTLAELTSDGGSDGRGCLGVADVGR
jgi:hypothetical protein